MLSHLLTQQARRLQGRQLVQQNALLGIEADLSLLCPSTVHGSQELLDVAFGVDNLFDIAISKLNLVPEMRSRVVHEVLNGQVCRLGTCIRHADGEQMTDQVWMPQGNSIRERRTPMAEA